MTIHPTSPHGPNRPADQADLERSREAHAQQAREQAAKRAPEAEEQHTKADVVEVSKEARALADENSARPPKGTLSPDRLRQIGERLASGHYDRAEVMDDLAKRLQSHPDLKRTE